MSSLLRCCCCRCCVFKILNLIVCFASSKFPPSILSILIHFPNPPHKKCANTFSYHLLVFQNPTNLHAVVFNMSLSSRWRSVFRFTAPLGSLSNTITSSICSQSIRCVYAFLTFLLQLWEIRIVLHYDSDYSSWVMSDASCEMMSDEMKMRRVE